MSDKDRLYKYREILSTRRALSAKELQMLEAVGWYV